MKTITNLLKRLLWMVGMRSPRIMNDVTIFDILGRKSNIRNGHGFGFISDEFLYDNQYLEIGFGRVSSGYGDWGGGFSRTSDSPLKIVIDRDCIIQKISTHSFYNNKDSQEVEKKAEKIMASFEIGDTLILEDVDFKDGVDAIFELLPWESHIGWDVFEHYHMKEIYKENKLKEIEDEIERVKREKEWEKEWKESEAENEAENENNN